MSSTEVARSVHHITGYLLVVITLIPLLKSTFWFVRIFDYPINQKFWVNLFLFLPVIWLHDPERTHDVWFLILLLANQIFLLTQIWKYTPLAAIQMAHLRKKEKDTIKIFISNVYQENRKTELCIAHLKRLDPDIVLLVETDIAWLNAVAPFAEKYPYRILHPLDNTYGMLLYSRLRIEKHEIRFLVEDDVPSFSVDLLSPENKSFRLFCLHPKPPVPGESDDSAERDAEILIVGKEAKTLSKPVIVAGDLNDVAWSYTTNLFLKVSGLLDPRIGRGFYSTFHAAYPLMRWPLDHVFCSSHFYLVDIQRLSNIGSDHFPIFIQVALMSEEVEENLEEKEAPEQNDLKMAEEKIEEVRSAK